MSVWLLVLVLLVAVSAAVPPAVDDRDAKPQPKCDITHMIPCKYINNDGRICATFLCDLFGKGYSRAITSYMFVGRTVECVQWSWIYYPIYLIDYYLTPAMLLYLGWRMLQYLLRWRKMRLDSLTERSRKKLA